MSDAYIFDAVHTPRGRRGGSLAEVHPVDLFTVPLLAILERNHVPADQVDDVTLLVVRAFPDGGDRPKESGPSR